MSLHWICALTLALVCCLSAQPVKRNTYENDLTEILKRLEKIAKKECPNNTKLYSPVNIREDCLSSALNCTIQELDVLKADCNFTKDEKFDDFYNLYTELKEEFGEVSTSPNCICEVLYNQTDVKPFLNNIKNMVEQLKSKD